ncbi:hypothetical protein [Nostoc sp. UHCC 0252]|uniref:hypothetical protein n=1 Tax=Nostoc sp. UHCC 0252 TaxID=3110241 RepID=UPI002B20CEAB|nr:hypothetical protein [Nostoc sp. UHCC 0252]MEA5604800.1 hypothetical protein [Nostoc sp. UHCC 0252]
MKQSQHLDFAIASLHFITLAMTKYVFTHLGCSRHILPELDNGLKAFSSLHIAYRIGQFAGGNMKQNARIYKAIYENTLTSAATPK